LQVRSKRAVPDQFHQILPEGPLRARLARLTGVSGIKPAGRAVDFTGPKPYPTVARCLGEADAGVQLLLGKPGAAFGFLDQEQSQLGIFRLQSRALAQKIDAKLSGPRLAIQPRSQVESWLRRKAASVSATSAPKLMSNPTSAA